MADRAAIDLLEQKFRDWERDILLHFEDCLQVRDHNTSSLVPLRLRKGQQILHNVAEKQLADIGYVRILLLKSRRFGGSTYVEGRFYSKTSRAANKNTFIVAHEEKSTATLFRMAKLFHQKNPVAPQTLASSAQELRFDTKEGEGLKSEYQLATAKNVDAGRSQGVHYLHISEEAYFPDGAEILLNGLMACLPKPPLGTEVFRESTANGYGNTFQVACEEAFASGEHVYYEENGIPFAWHNPKSAKKWVVVFIPWFMDETLFLPFDNDVQKRAFEARIKEKEFDKDNMRWVESEAMKLKKQYGLTLEQLHWREYAIENDCGGDLNKFHQEYPSNFYEAFLSAGQNVFSRALCDDLEEVCREPIKRGDLRRLEGAGKVIVRNNPHGSFSVWEECNRNDSYFITVDVAGGIKENLVGRKRKPKEDPDFTSIDVWNHRTGNQAAQWHGHVDYDFVADIVVMIGELYGHKMGRRLELPTAAVELNNHGYTVVARLKDMQYPQYHHAQDSPGWQANRRTKPDAVDSLRAALRDGTLKINARGTVSELRTYVEEGGKFAAAEGCNDDRVSSAYLAAALFDELPRKYQSLDRKRRGDGNVRFSNFKGADTDRSPTYQEFYA